MNRGCQGEEERKTNRMNEIIREFPPCCLFASPRIEIRRARILYSPQNSWHREEAPLRIVDANNPPTGSCPSCKW